MNPLETQHSAPYSDQQTLTQVKDNPFSPKGRFTRLSYLAWMFIVSMLYSCTLFIVAGIAAVVFMKLGGFSPEALTQSSLGYFALFLIFAIVLIFTIFMICITIRRIHDLNKSGWLWLLLIIPFINIVFGIYIMCAKGTEGANKYGPQRATEQTEKLLGTIYAIFLAIFIVSYGSIAAWFLSVKNDVNAYSESMEMTSQDHTGLEQQLEHTENQIEETEQHDEQIEENSDAVNQSAEKAVEAANAAEAAESQITQEANQR